MDDRKIDRTWLCSVVFLDIVKYSAQAVERQIEWKTFFNQCLSEVLRSVPPDDRVTLDTGDGAVIYFLGDPEAALVASLFLRNEFVARKLTDSSAPELRLGINLGPIRLIRDINGNLNAVGDGINVGQRIMAFAGSNQLLISRSYFDVISCLTEQYKSMFQFDGMRQDKHVREHAVYALVDPEKSSRSSTETASLLGTAEVLRCPPAARFDPQVLAVVTECLAGVIGPMAQLMVAKASREANTMDELCNSLAKDAVPAPERNGFLQACRKALPTQPRLEVAVLSEKAVAGAGSVSPRRDWDPKLLEALRFHLADHFGPIAKLLVSRATLKAHTGEELCSLLASNFTSDADHSRFLDKVLPLCEGPKLDDRLTK